MTIRNGFQGKSAFMHVRFINEWNFKRNAMEQTDQEILKYGRYRVKNRIPL